MAAVACNPVQTPASLRRGKIALEAFFAPASIAVVGATEHPGSVGRALVENLRSFVGPVHLVNPHHKRILGRQSFASIRDIQDPVDLAVVATPAETVPCIIRSCVEAGVSGAVILSAGFKECGAKGRALEAEILADAQKGGLRLIGPNCLGVMAPHAQLNATLQLGWPTRDPLPS